MKRLFEFDLSFKKKSIVGTDEVGRGSLAGPVVAAAVILPESCNFSALADSKKLSETARELAYDEIISQASSYAIEEVDNEEIDKINILNASKLAMKLSVNKIASINSLVLVDGNQEIDIEFEQKTLIKGDDKSAAIAAASILAKVYRDKLMKKYDVMFPEYAFKKHKGYATAFHREQIKLYGACKIHRRTFLGNIEAELNQMSLTL